MTTSPNETVAPDPLEARIVARIRASRQYKVGRYPYFVWPYKGIEPIEPDELAWFVDHLAPLVPAGTDTLLSFMTDGDLLTLPLALATKLPVLIARDYHYSLADPLRFTQRTGYFTRELYLARPTPGRRICIVEAIIASGNTVCAAAEAIRQCRCELTGVVAAIEKSQCNGREEIQRRLGVTADILFSLDSPTPSAPLEVRRLRS